LRTVEALKLTKDLVQTEVSVKYDELESKFEQTVQENKTKYNDMVLHYEKRLQNVRIENADLEKENVQLIRDKENLKAVYDYAIRHLATFKL
jgi:vacuolar-type H+-ATPase subunit E/Vma4